MPGRSTFAHLGTHAFGHGNVEHGKPGRAGEQFVEGGRPRLLSGEMAGDGEAFGTLPRGQMSSQRLIRAGVEKIIADDPNPTHQETP